MILNNHAFFGIFYTSLRKSGTILKNNFINLWILGISVVAIAMILSFIAGDNFYDKASPILQNLQFSSFIILSCLMIYLLYYILIYCLAITQFNFNKEGNKKHKDVLILSIKKLIPLFLSSTLFSVVCLITFFIIASPFLVGILITLAKFNWLNFFFGKSIPLLLLAFFICTTFFAAITPWKYIFYVTFFEKKKMLSALKQSEKLIRGNYWQSFSYGLIIFNMMVILNVFCELFFNYSINNTSFIIKIFYFIVLAFQYFTNIYLVILSSSIFLEYRTLSGNNIEDTTQEHPKIKKKVNRFYLTLFLVILVSIILSKIFYKEISFYIHDSKTTEKASRCDLDKECTWKAFKKLAINKDGKIAKWPERPFKNSIFLKVDVRNANTEQGERLDKSFELLSSVLPFKLIKSRKKIQVMMFFVDDIAKEGSDISDRIYEQIFRGKKRGENYNLLHKHDFNSKKNSAYVERLTYKSKDGDNINKSIFFSLIFSKNTADTESLNLSLLRILGINNPASFCKEGSTSTQNINLLLILKLMYDPDVRNAKNIDEVQNVVNRIHKKTLSGLSKEQYIKCPSILLK